MRAHRRVARGVLVALALGAWSRRAASQGAQAAPPVALDWSAPPGCPTRERVLDRITAILGRSTKPRDTLAVRAFVAQSPNGEWRVDVAPEREDVIGDREFEAESCDAAADATALIVSLMIDPTVVPVGGDEPSRTTAPSVLPVRPPPPRGPPKPLAPSVAAPRGPLFAVRASLAGDVGTFSAASVGGELLLAVMPSRLRAEVAGSWASSTAALAGAPSEGARLDFATLGARVAYSLSSRDVGVAPLVGVEAERMSASGFGGTAQHRQTAIWGGIDLGASGFWSPVRAVHDLALSLTLEAVVATAEPPPFVATEPGGTDRVVQQSSRIAARAFFGVEIRFF